MIKAKLLCGATALLLSATLAHASSISERYESLQRAPQVTAYAFPILPGFENPVQRAIHQHRLYNFGGQTILATYYGPGFHGRKTASGERFNAYGMTAAHKSLPFGTRLRVTNPSNGLSVVVRINDRGPYRAGYSLDLAQGASRALHFISGRLTIGVL